MGAGLARYQTWRLNSDLWHAVDRDSPGDTEHYISVGADPNAYNNPDYKPLLFHDNSDYKPLLLVAASRWNSTRAPNLNCCTLLLDHGADIDIDISTPHCPPALVLACKHNHINAVRLLIERGADVNVFHRKERRWDTYCERTGSTPLFAATGRASFSLGSTEVMSFLLDQGADPNTLVDNRCVLYYSHLPWSRCALETFCCCQTAPGARGACRADG